MSAAPSAERAAQTAPVPTRLFTIDRSKPFDPVKFIGPGWSIIEEDPRSLSLTDIDVAKVRFESGLQDGERDIDGEEKLRRLKERPEVRLDAKLGQAWYEEESQATLCFLHDHFGVTWFELPGTVLRDPYGLHYFLVLFRYGDGSWVWYFYWLGADRSRSHVSPLLAS